MSRSGALRVVDKHIRHALRRLKSDSAVWFRLRVFHPHELMDVANKVTNMQAQVQQFTRGRKLNATQSVCRKVQSGPPEPAAMQKLQRLWWKPRLCAAIRSQ
eukprot:99853-Amphidinium_carterae.1